MAISFVKNGETSRPWSSAGSATHSLPEALCARGEIQNIQRKLHSSTLDSQAPCLTRAASTGGIYSNALMGLMARREGSKPNLHVDTALRSSQQRLVQSCRASSKAVLAELSMQSGPQLPMRTPSRASQLPIRRHIRWCACISEFYELEGEVMPTCHAGMKVRFATSFSTRERVVIKQRSKKDSFTGTTEEQTWRHSTELLMNLQGCRHVAQIYEVLEDDDSYYVVMEKVAGLDLCELRGSQGMLEMHEVKEILHQLLTGIAELHESGVIHNDLKLENVMVERASSTCSSSSQSPFFPSSPDSPCTPCSVKLIDFDTLSPTRVKPREIVGTSGYISPEAYRGNYSTASDIFAIGVIAYSMVTDHFPFHQSIFDEHEGENRAGHPKMLEIAEKVVNSHIDWNHCKFKRQRGARNLIKKMLHSNPHMRPSAEEALKDPWLTGDATDTPISPLSPMSTTSKLSSLTSKSSCSQASPIESSTIKRTNSFANAARAMLK